MLILLIRRNTLLGLENRFQLCSRNFLCLWKDKGVFDKEITIGELVAQIAKYTPKKRVPPP